MADDLERPEDRRLQRVRIAVAAAAVALVVAAGVAAVLVDDDDPVRSVSAGGGLAPATDPTTTTTLVEGEPLAPDTTLPAATTPATSVVQPRATVPKVVRDLVPTTSTSAASTTTSSTVPACPTAPAPWQAAETGVYTVPTSGGPGRRIMAYQQGAGELQEVAYSPDGRQLALTRLTGRNDGSAEVTTLHLANADGTGERELAASTTGPRHIAWSPDGKRLVLRDWDTQAAQLSTSVLDVATEQLTRVATHGQSVGRPHWSPDGRRLAWTGIHAPGGVHVTDVAAGTTTKIDDGDSQDVSWSPDGTELAVARFGGAGGPKAVDVLRADGSAKRTVHAGAIVAAWSPVERAHLVTDTAGVLHVTDPDGGGSRFLANAHLAGWLRTGAALVATSVEGIHLVDLQGCRRTLVSGSGNEVSLRAWSPDGSTVLFVRHR